ncbi:MAG TPA: hypothetical protein VGM92_10405 [Candidatus Kapabacteria bacterium]|jgi:hypothetical protein
MKRFFLPLFGCCFVAAITFGGCADKMSDRHTELVGGNQGPEPVDTVHDYLHNGTAENTDGKGEAIAGGHVNSAPDSMWNQKSALETKAY